MKGMLILSSDNPLLPRVIYYILTFPMDEFL